MSMFLINILYNSLNVAINVISVRFDNVSKAWSASHNFLKFIINAGLCVFPCREKDEAGGSLDNIRTIINKLVKVSSFGSKSQSLTNIISNVFKILQ